MSTRTEIAHLLRRATFGPRAADVDAALAAGYPATVDALLTPTGTDQGAARTPPPTFGPDPYDALPKNADKEAKARANDQRREQGRQLTLWWLDRMVAADASCQEKLVFFWHTHWATSIRTVHSPTLMLGQLATFRDHGRGDFRALARAMVVDPALLVWLDGQQNTRKAPNENLARELMELFTLGVGNYTEDDVKAAARVLTGWRIDKGAGTAHLDPKLHDPAPVTVLGSTGEFTASSLVDLITGQPVSARYVAQRLWHRYASDAPDEATLTRLVAAGRDTTAVLRAVLTDPAFAATREQQVKQPVEWLVGAFRQLGVRPAAVDGKKLLAALDALGQLPLDPPNVGGWPAGAAWLTTSAAQARLAAASLLTGVADLGWLTALAPGQRLDALARTLVVDAWTPRTTAALTAVAGDPRRLVTLALASPEYTVS